ncbi:amidohydrolase [Paenibacillus sp. YYML68]|uniref:amidohydrolase family protein n=1 Tax=Paenibacillus sp. YYML68 TaxID=2909250 RepID=UPI002490FBD3|nr:amidohydrolase family protein [Paenibacillus sp. YYML68]
MRIDAHQHYWRISRGDYGWITPELPVLYRDLLPEQLEPALKAHQLDGTIVVQAAPTFEETRFLLELSEQHDSILGVVGLFDAEAASCWEHYELFRTHPKLKGVRVMIQDMADASAIVREPWLSAWTRLEADQTPVDLLVRANQLDEVLNLLKHAPTLHAVIDHLGKPAIAQGVLEPWREQLQAIAAYPNVYGKLSGMVTEANHSSWNVSDFRPYVEHALDCFGPERVMFGSDWPVCLLAGSYEEVLDVLEQSLPQSWGEAERSRLFGRNALQFYRI